LKYQGDSGEFHPILIDFGKSQAITKERGVNYLAPKADKRESTQSNIFLLAKCLKQLFDEEVFF